MKGLWTYLAYCRNHIRFVHVTNLEVLSWRKEFYNMVEILRRLRLKKLSDPGVYLPSQKLQDILVKTEW